MTSSDIVVVSARTDTLGDIGLDCLNCGKGLESRHGG